MGLIKKFTIVSGAVLVAIGGAATKLGCDEHEADRATVQQCAANKNACADNGMKAGIEIYKDMAFTAGGSTLFFAGTTLLALAIRRPKPPFSK